MRSSLLRAAALVGMLLTSTAGLAEPPRSTPKATPLRTAYYGDLHLHTSYSFDAYLDGATSIGPDEAYRFAKGEEVNFLGHPVRRREPLDFLAVTDHAENIGVFSGLENPNSAISQSDAGKAFKSIQTALAKAVRDPTYPINESSIWDLWWDYFSGAKNKLPSNLRSESTAAWERYVNFANRNYQPGIFTTFVAYEWTAMPNAANLHRNVIFKGSSAPYPFTSLDSKFPEDLWAWLESARKQGFEALAIPHRGNASNGLMYDWVGTSPLPMTRGYAEQRQANEPLSEIAQIGGASETHPLLSPDDESANYEIYDNLATSRRREGRPQGSYLRDALSRGLVLLRELGVNPYKYGFVGGSDLHGGLSVSAQADYAGDGYGANMGGGRPTRAQAANVLNSPIKLKLTSGNLTGVWAESNTRESIYGALRRRETFATSGTRLKFRFFGGWGFGDALLHEGDWVAKAYAHGVPMGGDLPANSGATPSPTFAIWAVKDPNSANLDRVQVIKVWEQDGQQKERVFDVVWAGARTTDPNTGKLSAIANTVDLKTGHYTNIVGAAELKTVWQDPEFDPSRFAAYYLRVLEIPTPRWSTLLAVEHGLPLPKDAPATEQQRGWSSPIWYQPTEPSIFVGQ